MELDDLRRQWQQPDLTGVPAMNAAQLSSLLKGHSDGVVEKMRRNTWFEIVGSVLLMLAAPLLLLHVGSGVIIFRAYMVLFEVLAIALLYHYYRQLGLLQRMTQADTAVRTHLGALCEGLRQLLRFYYRVTLAALPFTLLLNLGYVAGQELARLGPFRWGLVGLIGGAMLLLGGLAQLALAPITRWYLQRLYGRHLDRLEASLRELAEPEPATAG
jgi:hypothetical protein